MSCICLAKSGNFIIIPFWQCHDILMIDEFLYLRESVVLALTLYSNIYACVTWMKCCLDINKEQLVSS